MRDSTSLVKPTSNMSPLENAQHELFAQRYAAGASATSAYMAAGYEAKGRSAIASAHKLLIQPKVRARIRDLKTAIGQAHQLLRPRKEYPPGGAAKSLG